MAYFTVTTKTKSLRSEKINTTSNCETKHLNLSTDDRKGKKEITRKLSVLTKFYIISVNKRNQNALSLLTEDQLEGTLAI